MNVNDTEKAGALVTADRYVAPAVVRLGSISDLTMGAFPGTGDAFGGQDFSCCFG